MLTSGGKDGTFGFSRVCFVFGVEEGVIASGGSPSSPDPAAHRRLLACRDVLLGRRVPSFVYYM